MRIKIESLGFVYSILENPPAKPPESGEEWKQSYEDPEERRKIWGIRYDPAPLPFPLKFIGMTIHRANDFYSAAAQIEARNRTAFENLSGELGKELGESGYIWYPTTNDGAGFILTSEKMPFLSIIDLNNKIRRMCLGCHGAPPRILKGEREFSDSVEKLEDILNMFLKACSPRITKVEGKESVLEELTIHLTI